MKYTEVKNMVYANEENSLITCDVKFELLDDFIPFTASPDDSEPHGRDIYNECLNGKYGEVSEYVAEDINYSLLAEYQRQSKLSFAYNEIKDWRTELELGVISDVDKERLIRWMNYIKAIKVMLFIDVTDITAYESITWPVLPV